MVSHHFVSHMVLFALIWLVVLLYLTRPKRLVTAPAAPALPEPRKSKRLRSHAPTPFEGLTHKPHCALCERDTASPQAASPVLPAPMVPTTGVLVQSIPPCTSVRMPVVTTGAGSVWAICAPMAIRAVAPGASSTARRATVIFWKRTARSSMANRLPWNGSYTCWPAWLKVLASVPLHGSLRSMPIRWYSGTVAG